MIWLIVGGWVCYSKRNVQGDPIACYNTMNFIGTITAKKNARKKVSKIELYLMHTGQH